MGINEIILLMISAAMIISLTIVITVTIIKVIDALISVSVLRKAMEAGKVWYNDFLRDLKSLED